MLAFMIVATFDCSGQIVEDLEKYLDASACYLIGLETAPKAHPLTKGQHYHIFCDMTKQNYEKFRKTILVNKMNLTGQARNGVGRQYGIVKHIKDETKMMSYTLKSNNIIYKNFDLKTIQDSYSESYQTKSPKCFVDEIMAYLLTIDFYKMEGEITPVPVIDFELLEQSIVVYYIDNDIGKPVSKATLKSLGTRYLMYHHKKRHPYSDYKAWSFQYIKYW